jgi:hypothetical protein
MACEKCRNLGGSYIDTVFAYNPVRTTPKWYPCVYCDGKPFVRVVVDPLMPAGEVRLGDVRVVNLKHN